jgi:hypothetical protein
MTRTEKQSLLYGALIGGGYPIIAFILVALMSRFVGDTASQDAIRELIFAPLRMIHIIFGWSNPYLHDPFNQFVCAVARDSSGRITETSLGCEVMLGLAEAMIAGMLIGTAIAAIANAIVKARKNTLQ